MLLARLSLDGDEPLDAQAVQEMAARLRRFYVGQGFLKARLMTREIVGKDSEVQVFFSVFEDKPVRVERIVFTGQSAIPTEQLEELIESVLREGTTIDPAFGADPSDVERTGVAGRPAKGAPRRYHVDPTTIFDTVLYARAIREIEDLYKSQGFLNVQVGPPKLAIAEADARGRVVIPIREGEQARVASLRVEGGGGGVSQSELAAALTLQKGGVFSYLAAEEGRGRITQLFTGRGHLYAKVEDDETFDEPDHKSGPRPIVRVQVTYRVQPGPLVRVTLVKIESPDALRTLKGLIYDLMDIKVGDVLKPETLDRAQQALLRTGLFFSATLTPLNPQLEEGEKVLQVSLRERPTQSFLGSVGFSLTDGPRTTLQFQQANLFGRNLTFSAVGKADFPFIRYGCNKVETLTTAGCSGIQLPNDSIVDAIERVVDIGLSTQRLYPFANSLRASLDLIHERANRPSYTLTKFSAQATAESVQRRPWSAGLTLEVGKQIFDDTRTSLTDLVSPIERKLLLQPVGEMIFGSLRPTLTLDLRDEPGRTRKGFFAQLAGDYMKSLSDTSFHTHILRLQGLAAGYLPLPLGSSLVLSARAGYVFHFDDEKKTPPDRHFYLGGATTLRGFAEDSLQAEDARKSVVNSIAGCKAVISGLACTRGAQSAILGDSSGGDVMVAVRAEARVAVGGAWELAFFYDRGNLLADPGAPNISWRDLLNPHHAVGSGVRYATPIGRMALDLGVNLNPDDELGERRLGLYFSIDTL